MLFRNTGPRIRDFLMNILLPHNKTVSRKVIFAAISFNDVSPGVRLRESLSDKIDNSRLKRFTAVEVAH